MKWVLAQNCPCCGPITLENLSAIRDMHMAFLTDEEGAIVIFNSEHDASSFIGQTDENPEDILIIPEMEILGDSDAFNSFN